LLTAERAPLVSPTACGVKMTFTELLWLGARFSGRVRLLKLKAAPLTLAWVMVRLALPVLVIVIALVPVLPRLTLPKPRLTGLTVNSAPMPVPESAREALGTTALLVTERVPLVSPTACGVKTTFTELFWLGARVSGRVRPLKLKAAPLMVAWVMVRLPLPVLVKVTVLVAEMPRLTSPNVRLVGLALNCPPGDGGGGGATLAELPPAQPAATQAVPRSRGSAA